MEEQEEETNVSVTKPKNMIGGFLGKKAKNMVKSKAKSETKENPKKEIFESTVELKSVSTSAINSSIFEVPNNYKKQS